MVEISKALSFAEFRRLPRDTARNYELFDEELVVSPRRYGDRMEIPVLRLLLETAPVGWTVSFVPGGWRVDEHNFCDPDIKVASGDRFKGEALLRVPQLAVDFRSGTRPAREFALKRQAYAHAGLAHYWVIDSDVPSITVFELIDGELVEHAVIGGASVVTIDRPFPARICPDELADGCVIVVPRDEEEA